MSSDAIGEHYCLCELLLDGKEAYIANGATQKGWDIAVIDNDKTLRVQVKAINFQAKGQATIKGTFIEKQFDYLVIVLLNFNNSKYTTFVIPYEKLREKQKGDRNTLIDNNGLVYYSARTKLQSGNGYEKQAIAFSTIQKQNVYTRFKKYESNFESITA